MDRKRDGLLPIGEAFGGLDGLVKTVQEVSPQARDHYRLGYYNPRFMAIKRHFEAWIARLFHISPPAFPALQPADWGFLF